MKRWILLLLIMALAALPLLAIEAESEAGKGTWQTILDMGIKAGLGLLAAGISFLLLRYLKMVVDEALIRRLLLRAVGFVEEAEESFGLSNGPRKKRAVVEMMNTHIPKRHKIKLTKVLGSLETVAETAHTVSGLGKTVSSGINILGKLFGR